jgi:hypothetical protein
VKAFFASLAQNFNRMLRIDPGAFGSSPKSAKPGPGFRRARAREAAQRAAQTNQLAAAPKAAESRQVRRQKARRAGKMPVGMPQSQWHRERGLPGVGAGRR